MFMALFDMAGQLFESQGEMDEAIEVLLSAYVTVLTAPVTAS